MNEEIRTLDLFAGIGGFSYAAHLANRGSTGPFFRTSAFVERDQFCQRVLKKHWPDTPIFDDVTTLDADGLGRIDMVTAGFPCQPASVAGGRKGREDDRWLWPEIVRIVRGTRPTWLLLENVRGLLALESGMVFEDCIADLEAAGYESQSFIIPACAIDSAPHRRDRVWIVAYSKQPRFRCVSKPTGDKRREPRKKTSTSLRQKDRSPGTSRPDATSADAHANIEGEPDGFEHEQQDVADPDSERLQGQWPNGSKEGREDSERQAGLCGRAVLDDTKCGEDGWRGNARKPSSEICGVPDGVSGRLDAAGQHPGWSNGEPEGMQRVSVGVKDRAARLKALGNSIVPQVAEQIFRAILESERQP